MIDLRSDLFRPPRLDRCARYLSTLELPGREAALVEMVSIQTRRDAVTVELDLDFHFVTLHRIAAYRACRCGALSAERTVGFCDGQLPAPNRLARLLAEQRLVGHGARLYVITKQQR